MVATAGDLVAEMERVVQVEGGTKRASSEALSWNGPGPNAPGPNGPALAGLVGALVGSNLRQWDLEDTTRDPGASDSVVANAKREIDRLNIGRHHLVQEIDAAIDSTLDQPTTAPIATKSPGMVLDRLSVLVIRRARTVAASSHHPGYAERVPALESQLAALSLAFDSYMDELRAGTKRFIPYEHFKLYRPSPAGAD